MKITPKILSLVSLALVAGLGTTAPDPFASPAPLDERDTPAKRGVFAIKVLVENAGKEEANYMAMCSPNPDGNHLGIYSRGCLAIGDTGRWRVSVQADLQDSPHADLSVEVEDLKAFRKNGDGEIVPIEIFSTTLQSKGPGHYTIGELQGMTIKVEISKAGEAAAGQPKIETPARKPAPVDKQAGPEQLIISMPKDGSIRVDGKALRDEELVAKLEAILKEFPNQAILIRADKATKYEEVVRVLDLCRRAEARNVAFATERPNDGE